VGGQEAKPLEAERVLAVGRPVEVAIKFPSFYAFLNCKLQAVVYKKIVSYSYHEKAHDGAA